MASKHCPSFQCRFQLLHEALQGSIVRLRRLSPGLRSNMKTLVQALVYYLQRIAYVHLVLVVYFVLWVVHPCALLGRISPL